MRLANAGYFHLSAFFYRLSGGRFTWLPQGAAGVSAVRCWRHVSLLGYTDFLTRMGRRVVAVDAATWFDVAPRVFMPVPFDREINPRSLDWPALFAQGCTAARCSVAPPYGGPSYVLAIETVTMDCTASSPRRATERDAARSLRSAAGVVRRARHAPASPCSAIPSCASGGASAPICALTGRAIRAPPGSH